MDDHAEWYIAIEIEVEPTRKKNNKRHTVLFSSFRSDIVSRTKIQFVFDGLITPENPQTHHNTRFYRFPCGRVSIGCVTAVSG